MTGTLQPRKQQVEAIEAVGRLRQQGVDCRLDLYGYTAFFTDYARRCRELVTRWGLEDYVAFHDFETNMRTVLAAADVLVSVSNSESFPSALKEAMAAGALVVATPIGGIPELILDGETGILCTGTTVEAIADGIRRAAALDEASYRRIVEAARRVARAELHPNRAANDLMTMYVGALEKQRARQPARAVEVPRPAAAAPPATIIQTVGTPPLDYVSLERARVYSLTPTFDRLSGIRLLMGGPLETPVAGRLVFELRPLGGRILRRDEVEVTVRGAAGHWVELRFSSLEHSAGRALTLTLRLATSPTADIGVFETHHARSLRERVELRLGLGGARSFAYAKLVYAR
jgi:hypothetical protein